MLYPQALWSSCGYIRQSYPVTVIGWEFSDEEEFLEGPWWPAKDCLYCVCVCVCVWRFIVIVPVESKKYPRPHPLTGKKLNNRCMYRYILRKNMLYNPRLRFFGPQVLRRVGSDRDRCTGNYIEEIDCRYDKSARFFSAYLPNEHNSL